MHIPFRRALCLVQSKISHSKLSRGVPFLTWPLLRHIAKIYRLTAARKIRVVAVIGSLGKTTTSRAVDAALGLPVRLGTECNAFSCIAMGLLRVRPWDDHAVMEVGIGRKGDMRTYARTIRPDITVVTSIASEHHRSLGDLSATSMEKAEMVRALGRSGIAVLNGDDPNVLRMRKSTRARTITFGFSRGNDVRATDVTLDWPHGNRFRLDANGTTRGIHTRLIGRTFVYPVLAAVAVGLAEGFAFDTILQALEQLKPTPERREPVRLATGAFLLRDELKSTLETIDVALDTLAQIPARRKIVVLGDVSEPPGSQGPIYRRLGSRIAGIATQAIFVCSRQNCERYGAGIAAAMHLEAVTKAGRDLKRALAAIPADLGEGDVILVKGRDNQRLGRISLALMGREVRCNIPRCNVVDSTRCDKCRMLGGIE